ncbi:MAG: glutamyl-tRNA reductase [Deltaproteobacteria bacterium RBG_16_58_17]|nr:MAG: glutamyl-tRNA reductase [Deltaproteobacteria bacterium RBG_16_58_17]OHE16933.1 MAG: glutamyl-tRNA reductase [Syntrophobacterales bacterium GWC2_56_13]OHE20147.1 MAG: glutamyl-tRNA reductase [Syntrophobacterales bacterium GWF2_56_9]
MRLVLIGMNHKTAPLEIRERLQLSCGDDARSLTELMRLPEIREALCLATCNRVEVLARVAEGEQAVEGLREFIYRQGNLEREELGRCLYVYRDREAVRHLFRVASSLDSMVMGEPQILGQLKEAYHQAVDNRATTVLLNRLLHHAFRVAKRVRTETGIAGNAVSVSYAAVELAKKIFGNLKGKKILIIGAGEMSELAVRHLIRQGAGHILIANRTYERAKELAETLQGAPLAFDRIPEALPEIDIVIASTGAPGYIVSAEMVASALRRRRNRLLFLIDIAVPRDIDPAAGDIENVYLYNIDHLQDVVDSNKEGRRVEAMKAEGIIAEEIAVYEEWFNALAVVPTIVSLREKMEAIMKGELERSASWMKILDGEERSRIEILTASIVNKILHDPITALKEESRERDELPYVAAVRRLFKL